MAGQEPSVSEVMELETKLAATLKKASDEIAHLDTLDDEKRAEIYAILQALTSDSQSHQALLKLLMGKAGRVGHA
ncbi:MAG TPA: hypothetical protein PK082_01270 [Phycisphaerae bacterium]|nr:hypothetical protein [Phycisphaerae bacterium]